MCPLCIGTAAWLVSSGTSAGGITALVLTRRSRLKSRKTRDDRGNSGLTCGGRGDRELVVAPSATR